MVNNVILNVQTCPEAFISHNLENDSDSEMSDTNQNMNDSFIDSPWNDSDEESKIHLNSTPTVILCVVCKQLIKDRSVFLICGHQGCWKCLQTIVDSKLELCPKCFTKPQKCIKIHIENSTSDSNVCQLCVNTLHQNKWCLSPCGHIFCHKCANNLTNCYQCEKPKQMIVKLAQLERVTLDVFKRKFTNSIKPQNVQAKQFTNSAKSQNVPTNQFTNTIETQSLPANTIPRIISKSSTPFQLRYNINENGVTIYKPTGKFQYLSLHILLIYPKTNYFYSFFKIIIFQL